MLENNFSNIHGFKMTHYESVPKAFCVPDKKNYTKRVKKVFDLELEEMKFSV